MKKNKKEFNGVSVEKHLDCLDIVWELEKALKLADEVIALQNNNKRLKSVVAALKNVKEFYKNGGETI